MKYNCKKLSVLFAAVMMFVLACPVTVLAAAEEEAGTPAVYATFLPFKFERSSVEVTSEEGRTITRSVLCTELGAKISACPLMQIL